MSKQNRSLSLPTFAALAGLTVSSQALAGDQAGAKVGGKIYTSYGYDLKPTPYKGYKDGDPRPNGFNIDRVYLDYRKRIDETFSIRATTDVGWADSGKLELYLKYAFVQIDLAEDIKVKVGAAGNAQVGFSDKFWGNRWLAKSFTDQEKVISSSDFGVHASGKHADGMFSWGAAVVNGEGYKANPEGDQDKTFQARVTVDPLNGDMKLPISVYASKEFYTHEDVDGQTIVVGSIGFDQEFATVWGEYIMDTPGEKFTAENGDEEDIKAGGMSVNVVGKVPDLFNVVARYDKWDPNEDVDDDGHTKVRVGVTKNLAKKVDVGVMYESKTLEADPDQPLKGVFVRMQAGW